MGNESDKTKKAAGLVDHARRVLLLCRGLIEEAWKSLDSASIETSSVPSSAELAALESEEPDETQVQGDMKLRGHDVLINMRIREITEAGFLTNDIVQLTGGLGKEDTRQMKINGLPAIKLDRREFGVMLVLAKHAVSTRHLLDRPPQPVYLAINDILDEVENLNKARGKSGMDPEFWRDPSAEDVRRCVFSLRKKIREAGGNERLVESAPQRGGGYRLSTAWWNVIVALPEKGCSQDFLNGAKAGIVGT